MAAEATTERVLRLLALLTARSAWTATELAAKLAVTTRSVRRDVERLRSLGYPVLATAGVGGGYRLGSGTRLPPLLFDDDEAIATAICLRTAAGGTVTGADEAALRALSKLDQVMPARLRAEVRAVHAATDVLADPGVSVDADVLTTLARACRDTVRVRFDYRGRDGEQTPRTVEPVRLVATGRRWYLMAHDVERDDWRTFRLDRMRDVTATTWTFAPRPHPDPVDYVRHAVAEAPYRYTARVRLHAAAASVRRRVPPQVAQVHDDVGGWCLLTVSGDDLEWLVSHVLRLGFPAEVLDPPELRQAAADVARRAAMMAESPSPTP